MLKDKVAVVTGGSRGIGRAIALAMAEQGAAIALIHSGKGQGAVEVNALIEASGGKVIDYACDIANSEAVKETAAKITSDFGKVDILVNNAGITKDTLMLRMTEDDFDQVIDVNLKGAFYWIKYLSRSLLRSGAGRVINISSVSGLMGNAGQANYAAAKAGLIGLTKTVAKEYASRNVTCNAIAPGFITTDMTEHLPEAVKEQVANVVPLKRMGNPSEVAELAVFLASEGASYITGEVIRVDGGMAM